MAKARFSIADMKKQGRVEHNGSFVKVSSLVAKKVNKIKPTLPKKKLKPVEPLKDGEILIKYKPLSVNEVFKGKRFKSDAYSTYIKAVKILLPVDLVIPEGPLSLHYEFGFSTTRADLDNPVKPITDILQFTYNFNDSRIYELRIKKTIVSKGSEFIKFKIEPFID